MKIEKNYHKQEIKGLKRELRSERSLSSRFTPDVNIGLTNKQINVKILRGKVNVQGKQYSKSTLKIITSNLFTVFNLLCLVCVVALAVVNASPFNYLFAMTYVFNVAIAIAQEIKAKKSIEKLSIMNQPTAIVLRNGKFVEINVSSIVEDEIIKFSLGNQITADCTVLKGSLEVNESLLTGESVAIKKTEGSKLLAGSYVVSGNALAVADKVGEDRYVQKLAEKAKKYKKPSSELLRTLQWIIRTVGFLIVPIGIGVLYTNYNATLSEGFATFVQNGALTKAGQTEIVTRTTSVIIGMIPAGMLLLTTLALAVGIIRLARKNTSVQDMYAVERLARVDVLCLDKTGTITDGRMKVSNCVVFEKDHSNSINDIISSMQYALNDNNQTSIALRKYFGNEGKLISKATIPFSSERKYSAVSFLGTDQNVGTYALGAPEYIIGAESEHPKLYSYIRHYTAMGHRVLLLAYSQGEIEGETLPKYMRPLAIITLMDAVRKNAVKTIEWFKNNDVEIKVISGDNPITVSEVAKRAGVSGADKYISLEG
ncbi:MAG: HAD-IC family P-type ATPase, partial [Clostridia bacterium]|nr:HAD-IC family P-type ATPase [Clostridia bacterium]